MKTIVFLSLASTALAANWPAFRGPAGNGTTDDAKLPVTWSKTENVRWRVDLPERGNSSPIVWGDKVFITQAVSGSNQRTLMCFDRATGKQLWQAGTTYTEKESTQRDNPYCAATPVTDGERVIASFGSAGLYCYDLAGKELWHRDLGKMEHMFGNASSPVLAGELCILNFGPDQKARLVAVNKKTGEVAWEAQPPKVEMAEAPRGGFTRDGQGGGNREGGGDRPPGGGDRPATADRPPGGDRPAEGDRPGGGGFGGRGGGGFGPGQMVAPAMIAQGDKNADQKLSAEEFNGLGSSWFAKLDSANAGKVDQATFGERSAEVFSNRPDAAPAATTDRPDDRQRGGGRRGGGFGRFVGSGFFTATDANKDGAVTKDEWTSAFAKWFGEWDKDKAGQLDEAKLRDGLNAALPRPQFGGGPGGQGGGPGGGGNFGRGGGGGGRGGGASWSTPVLLSANGREELVISWPGCVAAYEPKTGKQLWLSKGLGGTIYASPVVGADTVVAMTSGPGGGNAIAVKPGGEGDVSEKQRLWLKERIKSNIGSGVIHEGHLYTVSQDGIAACTNLKDGATVWEERLKGPSARGSSWSSVLLAGDKLYVPNQSGDVFVLRAAPKLEILATNTVSEPTNASLAAADGELFLRTDKGLWCIAAPK